MIQFQPSIQFNQQGALVVLTKEQTKTKLLELKNPDVIEQIKLIVKCGQFGGEQGEMFPFIHEDTVILLVGIGSKNDISLSAYRKIIRQALLSSHCKKIQNIELRPHESKDGPVKAAIEGAMLGLYVWDKYKAEASDRVEKNITLIASQKKGYDTTITTCNGTNLARDLVNENADVTTSQYFENVINSLAKGHRNVKVEILNKKEMKAKGLGLHLAVNQGSKNEPKLIIVKYTGAAKKNPYTAFVGKGLTFDTGGLNLKPTGHIESMKLDMGGAAAVVGTLRNILELKPKKNLIFAVGMAENVTGSASYKPGDVITGYAGKTVEVLNTDAEGRLVLADAISYLVKNYKPSRLIDMATLTGACIVALGLDYSGLVTTSDALSRKIVRSSNETDDRVWRLPCHPELKDSVKSKIADIANLGQPKGAGGTITAAEFLRQFTEGTTWAHLDIAGTSFVEGTERMYFGHGGTGAGVRLMTHFLVNN